MGGPEPKHERRAILARGLAGGVLTALPGIDLGCCPWSFQVGAAAARAVARGAPSAPRGDSA